MNKKLQNWFLVLAACLFALAGCKKTEDYIEEDDAAIQNYLAARQITNFSKDADTGIYWYFDYLGFGRVFPTTESELEVIYTGYRLDGSTFISTSGQAVRVKLPTAIVGWRLGLVHFPVGSKGWLLVPSRLAYADEGLSPLINPNTPLVFEIELLEIHPNF